MQGTTLAVALLQGTQSVRGYDVNLEWYNKVNHLFEEYATKHDIDFQVFENNTVKIKSIRPTDLLYIDTSHVAKHLRKELNIHASAVNKYIILHDTDAKSELRKPAQELKSWKIIEDCKENVGYMVLKKK